MPTQKKAELIEQIKNEFSSAAAVYLVDYKGLTVKEAEQLRRSLRESDGEMKVYKNTLARIALAQAEMPSIDDLLAGPSAFIIAKHDPAAPAKAVKEFTKDSEAITIKGGIVGGKVVSAADVEAIAELPSHDQLIGMLIQTLRAPYEKLVRVLNGPNEKVVRTLSLIADKKGESDAA